MSKSTPPPDDLKRVQALSSGANTFFDRLFGQFRREPPRSRGVARDKERLLIQTNERLKLLAREKERDLERLRGAFDLLEEGVVLLDNRDVPVYMNGAARDLFGTPEEFTYSRPGQAVAAMQPPPDSGDDAVPLSAPVRIDHHDRTVAVRVASVSTPQGRRVGTLVMVRDVSGEQVSQRLRSHFIRSISHELKTPLAKIKGTADLLSARTGSEVAVNQMVESLIDHVDVLDRMVVEMLDLAEIGAGTFMVNREAVAVEPLLNGVVRGILPDIEAGGLEIVLMVRDIGKLVVDGDEARLRWALGHLLRNSIQYTEPKGSVMVVAGLDEDDPRYLMVDVIDSGVGISDDDLPRIFDRFYRGKPTTRDGRRLDPRGLGQGLYIARSVAEAHSGALAVRTTPGEGSIFTLTLPVGKRSDEG